MARPTIERTEEKERINVLRMLREYNEQLPEGGEKMTLKKLGGIVFPEVRNEKNRVYRLSRMNHGFVKDAGKVTPSHYRAICEALNCDMNTLFDLKLESED